MSAFSVSDLLNPAPMSRPASPGRRDAVMEDEPPTTVAGDIFAPELFQTEMVMDTPSIFEQQGMIPLEQSSSPEFMRKDSVMTDMLTGVDTTMDEDTMIDNESKKKERSTKQKDPEKLKDTRHSSKNEGQHTDRRYLCYVCNKLFTRRRSVRDHINKIHGEKTWEPTRSLEVIVEPHSGEPIEPIEEIIARGPPPPPPKSAKVPKPEKEETPSKKEPEEKGEPSNTTVGESTVQKQAAHEAKEDGPAVSIVPESETETRVEPEPEEPNVDTEPEPEPEPVVAAPLPVKMKKEDSQRSSSRPLSVEPTATVPAPVIGKKRPLAATKKGTAKVKSSTPSKRLKLTDSERSTPARSPSVTPAQKPGSKLKKPVNIASPSSRASSRQASPSPASSVGTPASSNDDGEIFCICRKGDNHTWMIACDGPCEEWFHGKCVGIRERDGELIDKYICPNCSQDGFITTWKRMCRRQECRRPARVLDNPPSKYCSVECGRLFFVDLITRGDPDVQASKDGQFIVEQAKKKKLRRKIRKERPTQTQASGVGTPAIGGSRPHTPAYSEDERSEYETDSSLDDEELPNRGGALRAGEVKSLVQQCRTIEAWRELGKKPETPPRELDEKDQSKLQYDDYENTRLSAISKELIELEEKLKTLAAREKMLELVKVRSTSIVDDIKKSNPKLKAPCGYDSRVAWCDEEFLEWYQSGGKEILESGKIGPPGDGDITMTNGVDESDDDERAATMKGGVCIRNNCPRHGRTWQKGQLAEVRFEQDLIKKRQDILAVQEHDIRSRAQIRALEMQKA